MLLDVQLMSKVHPKAMEKQIFHLPSLRHSVQEQKLVLEKAGIWPVSLVALQAFHKWHPSYVFEEKDASNVPTFLS